MTSDGNNNQGICTFRIAGEARHIIGSILPPPNMAPHFAQIYLYDVNMENQLTHRMNIMPNLNREILADLQSMMFDINPFVTIYKTALQFARNYPSRTIKLICNGNVDRNRYNLPSANEIAVIVPDGESGNSRDVILHNNTGDYSRIQDTSPYYDPLHYVLMFPHGRTGWTFTMTRNEVSQCNLTLQEYVNFILQVRHNNYLLLYGRLFHQYVCDAYSRILAQRLRWVRFFYVFYTFFTLAPLLCSNIPGKISRHFGISTTANIGITHCLEKLC